MTIPSKPRPRFTCPRCGRRSSHPKDLEEGYCAGCHAWTGEGLPLSFHERLDEMVNVFGPAHRIASDIRLAIVGSARFKDPLGFHIARALINNRLLAFRPQLVISGGAEGIDTLAEQCARDAGYSEDHPTWKLVIHRPKNKRWEPDGYAARNLLIAEDCTHLLAIRCIDSKTYGSGWTADRAQERGKVVWRVLI